MAGAIYLMEKRRFAFIQTLHEKNSTLKRKHYTITTDAYGVNFYHKVLFFGWRKKNLWIGAPYCFRGDLEDVLHKELNSLGTNKFCMNRVYFNLDKSLCLANNTDLSDIRETYLDQKISVVLPTCSHSTSWPAIYHNTARSYAMDFLGLLTQVELLVPNGSESSKNVQIMRDLLLLTLN
jgi:hypothetical protein